MPFKDKIVIYTPNPPEGYGAFDQWEDDYLDEENVILQDEYEEENAKM